MADKKSRQDIKQNQKRLYGLKEKLKKLELRPCQGDTDMKQKDEEIDMLKRDIYNLEVETNQFILFFDRCGTPKI